MVILILMVVVFLYYVITEYFQNSYIDCILFLTLLISHLIWDYYFLPIEVLVALSGVNLLSRLFKKMRSQQICQWIIKMKGKIGIFKMKYFFAGIGEIKLTLTIIGVVSVFILTIARIYRRFFYNKNKLDQNSMSQLINWNYYFCYNLLLLSFYIKQPNEVKVVYPRKENSQIALQSFTLRP